MKTFFLPLVLFFLMLAGCASEQAPMATLSGQLLDAKPQEIYLVKVRDMYGYRGWLKAVDSVAVDSSGVFRFSFEVEKPDFYLICDERGLSVFPEVYLGGGDSLRLVRKWQDYAYPIRYEGARAGAYDLRALRDSLKQNEALFEKDYREVYYLQPEEYIALMRERLEWEEALLADFFKDQPDWEPIGNYLGSQMRYRYGSAYLDYLQYHNYYTNDTFVYLSADSSFYALFDPIDLQPVEYTYQFDFHSFMGAYLNDLFQREYAGLSDSVRWEQEIPLKLELAKIRLKGVARDAALFALTDNFAFDLELEDFFEKAAELDDYFRENHTDEAYYQKFASVFADYRLLQAGNEAPALALPGIDGDTIRLSDLRGKVVYLDFWGTWCYPCLEELPHSLELQEKLKDEEVEFVFVGLESDDQVLEWSEFIQGLRGFDYAPFLEQRVYPGVHMLAEGQFMNPALKPWKIGYAPTYVLLDREGRIAYPRAPRPSDPDIEWKIRELLDQPREISE